MMRIYFDNNASTKLDPEVQAVMADALGVFGNPSSIHTEGRRARRAVEEARDEVAKLIGARSGEVIFTSGGTEANAMALFGAAAGAGSRIVTSAVEHPSVRAPLAEISRRGVQVELIAPDPDGGLDPERFEREIRPGTALVSVMAANNEFGALYPVAKVARLARAAGALFHTDAVQAAGRMHVDVNAWGADLAAISAHKLHGPKGAGALYVRRGVTLTPLTPGGGQEKKLRGGTENTVGLVGFGAAARLARVRGVAEAGSIGVLRDRLEGAVLAATPGARVLGGRGPRLPNTSAILFPGVAGEALAIRLDLEGVAVSVGSACSSGTVHASPTLLALGLSPAEALSVVRFSLSRHSTGEEVDRVAALVPSIVAEARALSTAPLAPAPPG